jgi:capsular exopolysaccharide synthesis family protein
MSSAVPPGPTPQVESDSAEARLWERVHVVLRRRYLVAAIFLAITAAVLVRTVLTRPVFEASATLLIERADPSILAFKDASGQVDNTFSDDFYPTQYKLLQSRSLARRVIEDMNLLTDPEFGGPRTAAEIAAAKAAPAGSSRIMEGAINALLGRVTVRPIRNSRLVAVAVESFRPELSAALANRLAELYIQQGLDFRFKTSSAAGKWLEGQVDEQRTKAAALEKELVALRQREGLVNIEERRSLLDQRLKELGTTLNERKSERLEKEALYRQMAAAQNPEDLPEVMRSPLVQNLRMELNTLERKQTQLLEKYLEDHPEVTKVRNEITETRAKIRKEASAVIRAAENEYKAAAAQEASITGALEAAKAEMLDLSRRTVVYESQKRELEAANQVLNSLLSRAKETDVTAEQKATNTHVVDPAVVPQGPVRPQMLRDMLLGMLVGLSLGIGVAYFLEFLDNTLKTPDDVRKHLAASPLLGVVPEQPADSEALVVRYADEGSPFVEGYRVVNTALSYSWSERGSRVLLVTSTAPGEGKTLTAVNLALTLASHEVRVLLVDCDLRKPQTHARLDRPREPGVTDVLVGKTELWETIHHGVVGSPLHLLPAGTLSPSPAALLNTRALRGLIDSMRGSYDWIVIDSPPVGAVAEPLVLAPLVDGVVVVVGAEMVPRRAVQQTLARLTSTGGRILGVILNRAQIQKHAYYYGHYFGHSYGSYYAQSLGTDAAAARVEKGAG